ncbi:hypothetical protein ACFVT5_07805 [Streptomyces sp. NPDC058001]|uniref:hypothetical protein n=1 Tax=Streptomyces sp. NPDC058001 TaxID=3346300 RepID=UPI0036E011E1
MTNITALTVTDGRFTDGLGREVVLRGYNVSGETKLAERPRPNWRPGRPGTGDPRR